MEQPKPKTYRFYSLFFSGLFKIRRDQKLFLEYTKSQKQRAIPRFIATGLLLQLFTALVPGESNFVAAYGLTLSAVVANLTLLTLHYYVPSKRTLISHMTWLVIWAQLLISALRRPGDTFNELLGWAALLQYLTFATLPFSAPTLLLYSHLSMAAYLCIQCANANMMADFLPVPPDLHNQEVCNASILCCANLLGATGFVIYANQHRRSFVETKRSLRDKLTIDQQSKEQERLLLSVLPEHVAIQMRKDLGLIDTQFKKIYMSRHENVSILYADIVGFTAISSTYSAQDLVAILNELFARFDRLAEKYQQLRIKILGDCYYCISGAPVERPDHAVLCVHMGLSMVKAIKYVQQTTNSPVDMRVGIHTGAVLAGVLGQRQWQFDVYSRDVELANKMESSGMAGRVHVSEVTLGYLKDEFEVEPAYGEKREEMLRQAGIKTYFIVKVLKPIHGDEKSGEGAEEEKGDTLSDLRDDEEDSVLSAESEKKASEDMLIHNMLEEELRNRDDDKELAATGWCLGFAPEAEKLYLHRGDRHSHLSFLLLPPIFLFIPIIALALFVTDWRIVLITYAIYAIVCIVTSISYVIIRLNWKCLKATDVTDFRKMYSVLHLSLFAVSNLSHVIVCGQMKAYFIIPTITTIAEICTHTTYYYHLAICGLCCGMLITPPSCVTRTVLLLSVATTYVAPFISIPELQEPAWDEYDPYTWSSMRNDSDMHAFQNDTSSHFVLKNLHHYRHNIMIYLVAISFMIFDRYLEALQRARHLRGERMRKQAEQAGDLRRRNQALVYNVLPPHVARHFMGAQRNHRDLYSQSYAEVGVLFASMPNFTEFYSEETVNNQGLECLRFLNEVISDFDTLLVDARFRDIIKIKTISSTYMAASGLNPEQNVKNADTTKLRWRHLMCLVEFALELQRVLAAINEQSFNHFVLRMGVNHGPITAGVIGAKKPHYDIWGNTVNVASRMESTGKAGCIQVTEETCQILKDFGYFFEQRGLVAVKGKGQLMTYYLQGRNEESKVEEQQAAAESCLSSQHLVRNGSVKVVITEAAAEQGEMAADIPLLVKNI